MIDYVGEAHLKLLVRLRVLPLIVPVVEGTLASLPQFARSMRGLLLVEGEDIDPKRYRVSRANLRYLEDPSAQGRDRFACCAWPCAEGSILGICRGSQNCSTWCGGTLHVDVQKEKESRLKHIDYAHYDTYRHRIAIAPASPLAHWYRRQSMRVNSYHHQGILRLASRFKPMAHAEDGLVEAYYDPRAEFLVGTQFHPERMPEGSSGNARLWKAFSSAVKRRRKA